MPLLDGVPLGARLSTGPLPWREAVSVAARLAEVLAATHAAGVVHQDVSAENVLLTGRGAVLLDFGLAVDVGSSDPAGHDTGTPPYVAPERLRGVPAQPAGDVYALGVLLFEMLVGRRPFPETSWEELSGATREVLPPRPDGVPGLPADVAALCQRALSADATSRPTADECVTILEGAPTSSRRRVTLVASAGVAAAAALVLVTLAPTDISKSAGRTADSSVAQDVAPAVIEPPSRDVVGSGTPADPQFVALATLVAKLDEALASGEVRDDVHLDLEQVATNLYWDGGYAGSDIAELREKFDDRFREGALSRAVWEQLHTELDALAVN